MYWQTTPDGVHNVPGALKDIARSLHLPLEVVKTAHQDSIKEAPLIPGALELLQTASTLTEPGRAYFCTVGDPDTQQAKIANLPPNVRQHFIPIVAPLNKMQVLASTHPEIQDHSVVVVDDNPEVCHQAAVTFSHSIFFHVTNTPGGAVADAAQWLPRHLFDNTTVVVDVDDTIYRETGPNGRVAKFAENLTNLLY